MEGTVSSEHEKKSERHVDAVSCSVTNPLLTPAQKKSKTQAERKVEYRLRKKKGKNEEIAQNANELLKPAPEKSKTQAERQREYRLRKKKEKNEGIAQNANELVTPTRRKSKSHAQRQREYRLRKKQRLSNNPEEKKNTTKKKTEYQRRYRLEKKKKKNEEIAQNPNENKPAKRGTAAYQREYSLRKKNLEAKSNTTVMIPRQESGPSSYPVPVTTAEVTPLSPDAGPIIMQHEAIIETVQLPTANRKRKAQDFDVIDQLPSQPVLTPHLPNDGMRQMSNQHMENLESAELIQHQDYDDGDDSAHAGSANRLFQKIFLNEDMLHYSYMGHIESTNIMKKGVVPRFFDCQQSVPMPSIPAVSSRSPTEEVVQDPGVIFFCDTSTDDNVEFILPDTEETDFEKTTSSIEPSSINTSQPLPSRMTRGTQTPRPSTSTKSIEAKPLFKDTCTSMEPMNLNVGSINIPWDDDLIPKMETNDNDDDLRTDAILYPFNDQMVRPKRESFNCHPIGDNERLQILQQTIYESTTRLLIQRDPMTFIGLPEINSSLIGELSVYTGLSRKDIHMILHKIRQDIPNTALSAYFGTDEATVVATLNDGLPKIANCLGQCIVWQKGIHMRLDLPPKTRVQYGRLESIIDILDIQIEYPGFPVRRITGENGRRYLISITPDGIVNYLSPGWFGTVSDKHIYENANYLQVLPEGVSVLTERTGGLFKVLLQKKQCKVLIPPIMLVDSKSTEITEANTIVVESVREYVHKRLRGLREFRLLENRANMDEHSFSLLDNAVIVAAALHNLKIKSLE